MEKNKEDTYCRVYVSEDQESVGFPSLATATIIAAVFAGMWLSEVLDPGWFSERGGTSWPAVLSLFVVAPITWLCLGLLWVTLEWPKVSSISGDNISICKDQPWRQPTDILIIERLKADLLTKESHLLGAAFQAAAYAKKLKEIERGALSPLWLRLIRRIYRRQISLAETFDPKGVTVLCAQIDRLWSGNARLEIADVKLEIQKLRRRRQDYTDSQNVVWGKTNTKVDPRATLRSIDERVLDLERDLNDLEELVRRAQAHPYAEKFEDKKTRRGFDAKDEIFEAFERPFVKEIELRERYNGLVQSVQNRHGMSAEQKADLLQELKRQFDELVSKSKQKGKFDGVYGKDA